jgi:ribA/ribD-fused uncharacterized protein
MESPHTLFCKSAIGEPMVLFKTGYSLLSNFNCSSPFTIDGVRYNSVEAWYQASKAAYFKDWDSHKLIMSTKSPRKMKEFGKSIKGYDENEWEDTCVEVMLRGVREKILQNQQVRELLISTKNGIIGESTSFDKFWSTGVDILEPTANDVKLWVGKNKLGNCLMRVRDELANEYYMKTDLYAHA